MDREEYKTWLKTQNGTCSCPEMAGLYKIMERIGAFNIRCEYLERNAGLENPKPENFRFIRDLKTTSEDLERLVEYNCEEATKLIRSGKVLLVLHDAKRMTGRRINLDEAPVNGDAIMTYHCAQCGQQIELAKLEVKED
jgi:hypothetical protein